MGYPNTPIGIVNRRKDNKTYNRTNKGRYNKLKSRAKRRGYPVELTFHDYERLIQEPCFYCKNSTGYGGGLDRIDNTKGYILENVLSCCGDCNALRGDRLSVRETVVLVTTLLELRKSKI